MKTLKNKIFEVKTYKLKTLSPTHIGTGNKYTKYDYYIRDKKVYVISLDKFLDKFIEQLPEKEQETLAGYIENNKGIQDFVKSIQDFVKNNANMDQGFVKNNANMDFKLLENSVLYSIDLVDTSKVIHGIWEEIKHPKGLYIPASTIKGAIRTAVLYCLLKENDYKFSKNGNIVLKDKNGKILAKGLNIQNFLEREFFGENQSDDIFKYLRVSDSNIESGFDNLECRKIYVANTTKVQDKKEKKHPEYYETIAEGTEFSGIEIFIIEKLINPKYYKTLEKIKNWKECLYEFSKDLIEAELKFWDNEKVGNMIKQAYGKSPHSYLTRYFRKDEVLRHLKEIQKENSPEEPVIRIGKLSGYLTHSIGLFLAKDKNKKPYDLHQFGEFINKKAKNWLFPLTRRLTLDNQTLGWCKLQKVDKNI